MDGTTATAFLAEKLRISTTLKVIDLAACSAFLWDYLLTIGMEVEYMWPGPITAIKVAFFLQRYLPFIDTLWIGLHVDFGSGLSPTTCKILSSAGRSIICLGLTLSELVLTYRAWAVWHQNKALTVVLPILFVGCFFPPPIILAKFIRSLQFVKLPPPSVGCVIVAADPIVAVNWILLLVWDALILILMLVPAAKAYKFRGTSALYSVVYGEGVVYYLYLFVLSTINILLLQLPSVDTSYRSAALSMSRCVHSILTTRVVLHIREIGAHQTTEHIERGALGKAAFRDLYARSCTELRQSSSTVVTAGHPTI